MIRYPGGCFADQYDWRDGVGPREKRPTRVNFWADTGYKAPDNYKQLNSGPQKYEPNWFGTDEFIKFCQLVGAQPYLAANLRSLGVAEFMQWLEYCNAPAGLTTALKPACGECQQRPLQRSVLGRWQRIVGLRRRIYAGGIRN